MTGFELIIAQAVSGVAVPVFQTLWGSSGKVLGMFGKTLDEKAKQAIFNASHQYAQNYIERHGILKVLGMREPVSLESVYTAVQFLDDWSVRSFESIETLEKVYRQGQQRSFQLKDCKKQQGLKVANEEQYLMVLGSPGAGKSTFLRRMGLEALKGKKGKFKHACIPVFIELKTFKCGEINIEHQIGEEFRICGFPSHQAFTAKALEQGKLLILLDGLDEVPTERMNEAIQQIQNFVDLYDKNRFISSCRFAAYRHNFRRFTDVALAEFDDTQIENFITNWFGSSPDTGQDCWQKLNKEEHKAAKELTQTPLLLTLVCLLYQHSRKFPNNRATLYERALRVLLKEWAAEKGIPHDDIYKGLDTKRKEMMLSKIAHDAFQADRLFLPRREITDKIERILGEMLPDEKFIDGEAVLKSMEVQHGVLVKRAEDIYSFSHLTIQEYLTAQYIDDRSEIEKLVTEHLIDKSWQEVFLLVAGLMRGGADKLLLVMEKEARNYINTPKLKALLRWASEVTQDSETSINPTAQRAIACAILCNCIRASNIYKTIDSLMSSTANSSINRVLLNNSNISSKTNTSTRKKPISMSNIGINETCNSVIDKVQSDPVACSSINACSLACTCANKLDNHLTVDPRIDAIDLARPQAIEVAMVTVNTRISNARASANDISKNMKSTEVRASEVKNDISHIKAKRNGIYYKISDEKRELNKIKEMINEEEKAKENIIDINEIYRIDIKIQHLEIEAENISKKIASLEAIAIECEREINPELIRLNAKATEIDTELNSIQAKQKKINTDIASLNDIASTIISDINNTNNTFVGACHNAIENIHVLAKLNLIKSNKLSQIISRIEAIKAKAVERNLMYTTTPLVSKSILQIYLDAFALNEELVSVSEKEAEALKNYLYVNCLMLDCKQAAVLVSRNTWETIEARMFMCSVS